MGVNMVSYFDGRI